MKRPPTGAPEGNASGSATSGATARVLVIVGVNLALVLVAVALAYGRGRPPELTWDTFALDLLPLSAAMGLVLVCRRLDLSLPALFVLAAALTSNPHIADGGPWGRLLVVCGICGGIGLIGALVTWHGRISSALWTALVAFLLWRLAKGVMPAFPGSAVWPPPVALGASLGLLLAGAALLGAARLVLPPSRPPILPSGWRGLPGLAAAWIIAAVALALAGGAEAPRALVKDPLAIYAPALAAAALGGAFILRGRWGAPAAVVLTALGHLAWSFVRSADLGDGLLNLVVSAAAPLAAIPLYLVFDWLIRRRTGESAPTGLLA